MSERIAALHCPYCAAEDLWPHESGGGEIGWECRACLRAFQVRFLCHLVRGGAR